MRRAKRTGGHGKGGRARVETELVKVTVAKKAARRAHEALQVAIRDQKDLEEKLQRVEKAKRKATKARMNAEKAAAKAKESKKQARTRGAGAMWLARAVEESQQEVQQKKASEASQEAKAGTAASSAEMLAQAQGEAQDLHDLGCHVLRICERLDLCL